MDDNARRTMAEKEAKAHRLAMQAIQDGNVETLNELKVKDPKRYSQFLADAAKLGHPIGGLLREGGYAPDENGVWRLGNERR